MKFCRGCETEKSVDQFYKSTRSKDGLTWGCKSCMNERNKQWVANNPDKKREKQNARYAAKHPNKIQRETDPAKIKSKKEISLKNWKQRNHNHVTDYQKQWCMTNASHIDQYRRDRYQNDLRYRLATNLRNRLKKAIKDGQKNGSAVRDLGCSIEEFKEHIEHQFQPGMSWDNWSYDGWHIDHITALSEFDLTDRNQLLRAVHYTNLQPLWQIDNMRKGGRRRKRAA